TGDWSARSPCRSRAGAAALRRVSRNQLAGVEDSRRIQSRLDRAQHLHAQIANLVTHPRPVVGADRVVMGDGAAGGDDRLRWGLLGGPPLLDRIATLPGGDGEVPRRAGGG